MEDELLVLLRCEREVLEVRGELHQRRHLPLLTQQLKNRKREAVREIRRLM